ncbi:MAG: mechanosensitive ion channel family protein [Desulfobacterales bacterium]
MKICRPKLILFRLSLVLGIHLLMPPLQVLAHDNPSVQPYQTAEPTSSAEVDSYLAGMSDEQVRQAYAQRLKQDVQKRSTSIPASEKGRPPDKIVDSFYGAAKAAAAVLKRLGGEDQGAIQWGDVVVKLSAGKGVLYLFGTILGLAVIIALGLVLRWLFLRTTADIRQDLINAARLGKLHFFGRLLSRMLLDAMGIGVYVLTTFILFVLIYQEGKPSYDIVSVYLIVSYYIMVFLFAARIIFAPKTASLRLFPMEDRDASFMYNWIVRIVLIVGIIAGASTILRNFNVSRQLYLMTFSSAGAVVILALVVMIWQSRKRMSQAILAEDADQGPSKSSLRAAFARNWHYVAILYALLVGGIWVAKALNEENVTVVNLILSIFLIPIVIGVDQWVQRLLKIASGESRQTIDLSGDVPPESEEQPAPEGKMDIINYIPLIRRLFRIFLVAFLFFAGLRLWGIDLSIGRMFTSSALSILAVLLLSFIAWQLIKTRIDQKLQEEMPETDEDAEEGGAGGSRLGTLLVLLRKFVLAVMFVIVALIILASMGVNIGPLIAGAGVVGLAIGFGAQTLVKDIISGVFFLIDDAFRVGDYIETGGTKGSVEHISLRSLRLRNARGPVHTIPFGSMGTVTNMSRDYIITKLDFRVRYDTDVDKVRKIIKKINLQIAQDPEMGSDLLDKIKSQGVKEMDDSAMIMRVKYKTVPGGQFVIRREVYRLLQEAFRENGIEFAHRNVTVYMPPEAAGTESGQVDKKVAEAGAAAAVEAVQAEEEKQKPN